ncbi:putative tail tube protein [Campylobacter phage F207]|uniref:Putative tail tube protein n=1 Tax=Campylobacter phage F207 TaxID=2794360 RepID=A0A7T3KCX4_9CAUD|nr:putative tail tube protein [Campylobacter phage F207]
MGLNKFDSVDYVLSSGQRPFRYKVSLNLPAKIAKISGALYDNAVNILCKGATLPAPSILTTPVGLDGRTINIPTLMKLDNTTNMTFFIDEKSSVRRILEYWTFCIDSGITANEETPSVPGAGVANIVGSVANIGAGFISDITSDIPIVGNAVNSFLGINKGVSGNTDINMTGELKLTLLNYSGNAVGSYTYKNIFPIDVTGSDMQDDQTETINEFSVTFGYTHYVYKKETESIIDAVTGIVGL